MFIKLTIKNTNGSVRGHRMWDSVKVDHLLVAMIGRLGIECIRMGRNVYYYFVYVELGMLTIKTDLCKSSENLPANLNILVLLASSFCKVTSLKSKVQPVDFRFDIEAQAIGKQ